jgi:DsbC/DsbD-like thiol-disulfide interchange protein
MTHTLRLIFGLFATVLAVAGQACAQDVASPWVDQEHAKSRLLAADSAGQFLAFVEIQLPEGWKTYWRNPGDAGGLPPSFDFSKSENVAAARVLYPAPKRLTDRAGDTIGYKGGVVFPVEIDAAAKDKPIHLRLAMNFGVCREICVPLEVHHELTVAPGAAGAVDGALAETLAHVPRDRADAKLKLNTVKAETTGGPRIVFDAAIPAGAEDADLFVEAPEGLYVPMVKRTGEGQFTATIASEAELKQLLGQPLKVTLVSKAGSAETTVTLAP